MKVKPILGEDFAKLHPSVKINPCKEKCCDSCIAVCSKRGDNNPNDRHKSIWFWVDSILFGVVAAVFYYLTHC